MTSRRPCSSRCWLTSSGCSALDIGQAIRLNLTELQQNAYLAQVQDRTLFRNATFVIEVAAGRA